MRIAMLAPRATVQGPLPKHTPLLVEGLRRLGCEVELLPWGRRVEGERLPAKLLGRVRDVADARRAIIRGGFDVVVVKTAHDWLTLTRDLVLLRSLPQDRLIVVQFHGSQSPRLVAPGSWPFKLATKALLAGADGVLVLSREEQAEWEKFSPRSRVFVVRNVRPAPPDGFSGQELRGDSSSTILCVARLLAGKGVFELVQALPLVQRKASCRLVLVGDGPEATRIRALAEDQGVADSVKFTGYVGGQELASLYRTADVFALPTSMPEGFPTAILEAMAAGLPIVTTASRGPADHLAEGRNALFVPAHDVGALTRALIRLLRDDELRREMGDANREKVREFDPDPVACEYLAVLKQIAVVAAGSGQEAAHLRREK
jgi:glycosyltransferase involved in cell wall biosynthesis